MGNPTEPLLLRNTGKTVYILGAGFSRPGGGLIMSTFGMEAFRYLKENYKEAGRAFARIINDHRAICELLGLNVYNIEQLFSLVDMPGDEQGVSLGIRRGLIRAILSAILESFQRRCKEDGGGSEFGECVVPHHHVLSEFLTGDEKKCSHNFAWGACVYEAFICKILSDQNKPKRTIQSVDDLDTVITLNWDLLIERMIYDRFKNIKIFYGDGILNTDCQCIINKVPAKHEELVKTILLLKLHGSIHWKKNGDGAAPTNPLNSGRPENNKTSKPLVSIIDGWENQDKTLIFAAETGDTLPMIFPTWRRESRDDDIFPHMADMAIRHLRLAEKIVVIGYSMPETDLYFRYLMARGLEMAELPVVEVWDIQKEEAMQDKLATLFGRTAINRKRVTYFDKGLLGFVKSHPLSVEEIH